MRFPGVVAANLLFDVPDVVPEHRRASRSLYFRTRARGGDAIVARALQHEAGLVATWERSGLFAVGATAADVMPARQR